MRKILLAILMLVLLSMPVLSQTTTLTGTIRNAQGNLFNGFLRMRLSHSAVSSGGFAVVPTWHTFRVRNGALPSNAILVDTSTLTPTNTYYISEFSTTFGTLVARSNYSVSGATFNIGAAPLTTITTNQVGFANPVVTNPSADQRIVGNFNLFAAKIDNIRHVDASGEFATLAAAISDADAAGGGIVVSNSPETLSTNPFAGITNPIVLKLGCGAWSSPVDTIITSLVLIEGSGDCTEWNVTGATNAFSFGVGSDQSIIRNLKVTGNIVDSVHGVSVTGASTIVGGRIVNVHLLNFKGGAGVYLGNNAISWAVIDTYSQGNRYGYKCENTCNNSLFLRALAINNHASDIGTQFQFIGGNGNTCVECLSEVTNAAATVEGIDIQGAFGTTFYDTYVEHLNAGKAIKVGKNGAQLSENVAFIGGTLQGAGTASPQISLEGDRRTKIERMLVGLDDAAYNNQATDLPFVLVMSAETYDPRIQMLDLWKIRIIDNGAKNATILETPERYIRNGGLYETNASTNSIRRSEEFDNATWAKTANITVTANDTAAPDGTMTADKIEKTGGGAADLNVAENSLPTSTALFVASVSLRADTAHRAQIQIIEQGVGVLDSHNISVGTTWRRFYISQTTAGSGSNALSFHIQPVSQIDSGNGFVYAWGAQFEQGNLTDYIPTIGTAVTRPRGLSTSKALWLGSRLFAQLGTPSNGTLVFCPDCTIANPCAGAGTGALAKRLNGIWVCN